MCKEDGAGMGEEVAQVKIAQRLASACLNTGDVVVGSPRFPTTAAPEIAPQLYVFMY